MRLIGQEGEQIGIVPVLDAQRMAEEAEVDLVEIAPLAKPPVCKLMDFGKFKYREAKKLHETRLKQKQIQVKEVKFRPGTDDGDYKIKLRNLTKFLEDGDKAKVTLRYRGREMAHQEFGVRLIQRVKSDLEAIAVVEQWPKMEGRQLIMVLAPKKVVVPVKAAPKAVRRAAPKAPETPKEAVAASPEPGVAVSAADAPKDLPDPMAS